MEEWEEYLDSPFRETCAGVRRRLPLFFRGLETPGEILYRQFGDLAEVEQVETVLAQVPSWFSVMRRLGLLPERRASEQMTLEVLWNTAFARWVVEGKVGVQPVSRAELGIFQERLRETTIEEVSAAFLALVLAHLKLTAAEEEAMRALAAHAREKLHEVLAIEAATADLRFVEGLLVTE
jgi:hypothetical protein